MEIYPVLEDSIFFSEFLEEYLKNNKKIKSYLDMGTGSGILIKSALKYIKKEHALASDINVKAVNELNNQGIKTIHSDLFNNINGSFDLITFNAPYLPLDKREPKSSRLATTGGKRGDEISVRFLKLARRYLNKDGLILLLVSSLTPIDKINYFNPKELARKKMFAEDLIIYEIKA